MQTLVIISTPTTKNRTSLVHLKIAFTDDSNLGAPRTLRGHSRKVGSIDDIGVARDNERYGVRVQAVLLPAIPNQEKNNRQSQDAYNPIDIHT